MAIRGSRTSELTLWAVWMGSLWFLAILVAPALFKWLPRPEAGLVAGRFFYMLALYSLVSSGLLLALSNLKGELRAGMRLNAVLMVVLVVALVELLWLHPHMNTLRQSMASLPDDGVAAIRAEFGNLHALSSVLYSVKMIGALVWGLGRFTVKPAVTR